MKRPLYFRLHTFYEQKPKPHQINANVRFDLRWEILFFKSEEELLSKLIKQGFNLRYPIYMYHHPNLIMTTYYQKKYY